MLRQDVRGATHDRVTVCVAQAAGDVAANIVSGPKVRATKSATLRSCSVQNSWSPRAEPVGA